MFSNFWGFKTMICTLGLVLPLLIYRFKPVLIKEILFDIRQLRILFYIALATLGMSLYLRQGDNLKNLYVLSFVLDCALFVLSLVYAATFAIITNNIEDIEIDKISNKNRPLVKGTVNVTEYYKTAILAQFIALIIAATTSKPAFYGVFAISLGYFIYSCKPLRLKRIPIIAKIIIGLNALSMALCGFVMAGGQLSNFPLIWIVFIMIPLSLAANFIDLKDVEGDAKMGIMTLPVLWGEEKARHFIALSTIATYMMGAYLHRIIWVMPLNVILCIANVYFLYRKPFDEKWVFVTLVSAMYGLSFFLFFSESEF